MPSIRILPDRVANQIAAGEVIERPVAVVKELVENSLDAGADRIEIEFRNGGKSYIRVSDNGFGMSPDDALLSLERHGTSKIREAADLHEVRSFGFRGEALPSIASVSRFRLRTRRAEAGQGTEVRVNGGKLLDRRECGMAPGTVIEVEQLFSSVPVRRKFLKTEATETAHITHVARLFATAHPAVAFRVLNGSRQVFQSPSCNRLEERIAEVWGRGLADLLIPIEAEDREAGLAMSGLTARPGVGRTTRRELVTLVNRRPVDSRTLGFAVLDAYHGRLQQGRYPPAFLFLSIDPGAVDVNVHPAKREVRFRDEARVRRFVISSVTACLDSIAAPVATVTGTEPKPEPVPTPAPPTPPAATGTIGGERRVAAAATAPASPDARDSSEADVSATKAPVHEVPVGTGLDWNLVGCFQRRYGLFETTSGLLMLDLRHADRRVRYERIEDRARGSEGRSQRLLLPVPLEFEPLASDALESRLGELEGQGFRIEPFGRHFFRLLEIPDWLDPGDAEPFVRDLVERFRLRGAGAQLPAEAWKIVAQTAGLEPYCRGLDRGADAVTELAAALMRCRNPHTTPDGKPTYQEISWQEWQRRFGRE